MSQGKRADGKVKVLFFTSWLGGGGAEMHLLRLVNHLDRGQFDILLALSRCGGAYEKALALDILPHYLVLGRFKSSTVRTIRSILPLRKLIEATKPDIVCAVMDHLNVAAILATRNLPHKPKLVLCIQYNPAHQFQNDSPLVSRIVGLLAQRLYPEADQIVALSNGVAREIQVWIPHAEVPISVIHNAGMDERNMDLMHEVISKEEMPGSKPHIVACGRLVEQKGFCYLIDAMALVRQVVPATLFIVGEGKLRHVLESQIKSMNLEECVSLLGFKPNPYKYMASADVFVLSSIAEGFGNVIVEAMACGTPVVSTDCPYGPREIIQDGVNGLLVPPADSQALATAILRVLQNPDLAATLAQNGARRAMDFSADTIANEYGNLFISIAGQ